jgi:hypothetical protein
MCGHGMIPANLIESMIVEIRQGKKSMKEGALELPRPCVCAIYHPIQTERLLQEPMSLVVLGG